MLRYNNFVANVLPCVPQLKLWVPHIKNGRYKNVKLCCHIRSRYDGSYVSHKRITNHIPNYADISIKE